MKNFLIVLFSLLIFFPAGAYLGLNAIELGLTDSHETIITSNQDNISTQVSGDSEVFESKIIEGYNFDAANMVILGAKEPIEIEEEFLKTLEEKQAVVTNFTLPYSDNNLSKVYIATAFLDEENESSYFTTEIYRYDFISKESTKVFEYFSSNESAATQLRPIATDGDLLIVQKEQVSNEPGSCATVWTEGELMAFDLNDNDRSLVSYTAPESIQNRNQMIIERCEFMDEISS